MAGVYYTLVMSTLAIRPAATVLLLREGPSGPEVLLVQRASELAFHGGAWVFPGGRVDEGDEQGDGGLMAATRAAVRETFEETAIHLDQTALVPFSHWTTPERRPRRFATWFFVTHVEPGLQCVVDGGEIRAHRWLTPQAALEAQARQELELPPPTYVSLAVLCAFSSVAEVVAHARCSEPPVFVPRPRETPDGIISLYHGDAAYEGADVATPGPRHRLSMLRSTGYRYECTTPD